jgi:hypothetical protein
VLPGCAGITELALADQGEKCPRKSSYRRPLQSEQARFRR